jgi:hypothetical protein
MKMLASPQTAIPRPSLKRSPLGWAALGAALLIGQPAMAARFANQFTEFELPPGWQCSLEGAEWVCQNTVEAKKRDAIIVLAAKLKGDQDSLDQYMTFLKKPKLYTSVQGKAIKSEIKSAGEANHNGHPWADALHVDSEIPDYYTRYLATVKNDIGVLVTYSIQKAKYSEYLDSFNTLVKTLRVFRKAGGLNPTTGGGTAGGQIPNLSNTSLIDGTSPLQLDSQENKPKDENAASGGSKGGILLLIAAALAGLFLLKKLRGGSGDG